MNNGKNGKLREHKPTAAARDEAWVDMVREAAPDVADGDTVRDAVLAEMRRREWSIYQVWDNTRKCNCEVPRTVVFEFLREPKTRDITLTHADNLLKSLGITLVPPCSRISATPAPQPVEK